ncbi:SDR family NAD(P)-dependent oxidoreductase [Bosea thiooxidans]|nr:SDR family NAD(P)-dependent oxidoreductase [Bosea sp. (in: a-proteobacteria)]
MVEAICGEAAKRALITGGSRGIGLGCAAAFVRAGADVTLIARSHNELDRAAAKLRAEGGNVTVLALDLNRTAELEERLASAGHFDILLNNAGVNRLASMVDITEDDFDFVSDVNEKGALFVSKIVVGGLIDAGKPGSIIHVSSILGHVGGPQRALYVTSKHAIEGLTKAMAVELGQYGIRVNSIAPAVIETEMTGPILQDPDRRKWFDGKVPLGRFGRVEDIMGSVVFLASDASSFITGASLRIDGGWTAQ